MFYNGTLGAVNAALACPVNDLGSVTAQVVAGSTFAGANLIFEASIDSTNGSDGTWVNINAVRSNANTVEVNSGAISAVPAYAWEIAVSGYAWFRLRLTALTSGSVKAQILTSAADVEPAPAVQTHAVTQSGSWTTSPPTGTNLSFVTAASTNGANAKSTAGNLFEVTVSNPTATPVAVKFYDKATAPTVGTDVPVLTIPVAAGAVVSMNFGATGKRFAAGIGRAVTAAAAATDTAAAVAGVQVHGTYV